jgi:hypothetical protein
MDIVDGYTATGRKERPIVLLYKSLNKLKV